MDATPARRPLAARPSNDENAPALREGAHARTAPGKEKAARTPAKRALGALGAGDRTPLALRDITNENTHRGPLSPLKELSAVGAKRRLLGERPTESLISPLAVDTKPAEFATFTDQQEAPNTAARRPHKSPRLAARTALLSDVPLAFCARALSPRIRRTRTPARSGLCAVLSQSDLVDVPPVDTCTRTALEDGLDVEAAAGIALPRLEDICLTADDAVCGEDIDPAEDAAALCASASADDHEDERLLDLLSFPFSVSSLP